MNKTRGQSVLKILNGGVKTLNYPTPPGSKFPISWGGWRCELGGFNPPNPPVKSNPGRSEAQLTSPHQGGDPVFYTLPDLEPVKDLQHVTRPMTKFGYLPYKTRRRANNTA